MLRSFKHLASVPDAPLRARAERLRCGEAQRLWMDGASARPPRCCSTSLRNVTCFRAVTVNVVISVCSSPVDAIAVALPCLCEFVWVLRRVYGLQASDVACAIRALLAVANVEVNRPAVEAGLSLLEAGGDFADGVIAFEGSWLGGESFVSFDKEAVALLTAQDQSAHLL
jgi:predicted nucleic-acid-binding protein